MNAKRYHLAAAAAAGWLFVAAIVCAQTQEVLAQEDAPTESLDIDTEVPEVVKVLTDGRVKLTPSLIDWISHQSEGIIEELEAIAKFNAESNKFSVVSYLRYLTLFNHLKVVANKPIDKFSWIARKAKTLSRIYNSAMSIVMNYLQDVNQTLRTIEDNEPKSKQTEPTGDWFKNYEIIRFVALHVSS